ncbi:MAG: hypothetical protein HY831_03605 [Candidatus Aenigmarchaeota archaeon]|nr:hypothetical protein [Candidatus Aenigmarchaeota archaeon]
MRNYIATTLILAIIIVLIQNTTSAVVSINVIETGFTFSDVSLGALSSGQILRINNTGDQNISSIYIYTTNPTQDPAGTGQSINYDTGNFILFQNNTSAAFFANHVEFNQTNPVYVTLPLNSVASGRFHFGYSEYFWALKSGSTGINCTNGTIFIGSSVHNRTSIGDIDLSDNAGTQFTSIDSGQRGGADISIGIDSYCGIVEANCSKITIVKWNKGNTPYDSGSVCNNDYYIYTGSLQPNQTVNITIFAQMPYGVGEGSLKQGIITVVASA